MTIKQECMNYERYIIMISQRELSKESVKSNPALQQHYQETIQIANRRIQQIPTWTNAQCKAKYSAIPSYSNRIQNTIAQNPQLMSHLEVDPNGVESKLQELVLDKKEKLKNEGQRIQAEDIASILKKSFEDHCAACYKTRALDGASLKLCQCRVIRYCGKECQTADWPNHKKSCTARTKTSDSLTSSKK